jgi:hypothetical protein
MRGGSRRHASAITTHLVFSFRALSGCPAIKFGELNSGSVCVYARLHWHDTPESHSHAHLRVGLREPAAKHAERRVSRERERGGHDAVAAEPAGHCCAASIDLSIRKGGGLALFGRPNLTPDSHKGTGARAHPGLR